MTRSILVILLLALLGPAACDRAPEPAAAAQPFETTALEQAARNDDLEALEQAAEAAGRATAQANAPGQPAAQTTFDSVAKILDPNEQLRARHDPEFGKKLRVVLDAFERGYYRAGGDERVGVNIFEP